VSAVGAPAAAVEVARAVTERAGDQLELILGDLAAWVDRDSPTYHVAQLDALAAAIGDTLAGYGFDEVELVPHEHGAHLHAAISGPGRARVALLCHHDTVFPLGTTDSWRYARDGDRVTGPGVCDMKGGIAVAAHAVRLLAELEPRRFARVELVSVPDEEERDGAPATLDRLRGFDAVLCLECGREDHAIVSARKGGRWLSVEARGRAAHAGVEPDAGRNAVTALAAEALRISALHGARERLTLVVTEFEGGEGINTVPSRARMTLDLRGATEADLAWAEMEIDRREEHDGIAFERSAIAVTPALERSPAVAALAETAIALGAAVGHDFGEQATGGTSDAAWSAGAGITSIDGLGPVGGKDHTRDEYALVSTFAPRCGVVAGLIAAIDGGLLSDDEDRDDD